MKYTSMASSSRRGLHQSNPISLLGSKANERLPSGRSADHESSITAHPDREITPFSISPLLLSPTLPSRVRHIPFRLSGSGLPGYHVSGFPLTSSVIERLASDAGSVAGQVPFRYLREILSVVIYTNSESDVTLNSGTTSMRRF